LIVFFSGEKACKNKKAPAPVDDGLGLHCPGHAFVLFNVEIDIAFHIPED